jgi:hypothetical protein
MDRSCDSSVGIATGCRLRRDRNSSSGRVKNFHVAQTGSGAHPDIGDRSVKLTSHLQRVPRSRKCLPLLPPPSIFSHGIVLS